MAFKDRMGIVEELKVEMVETRHELVLEFKRALTQEEWREVIEAARSLPYVQELRAETK